MYGSRAEAERALWKMAGDGRVDCHHDRRFHALVLLATFASLRWGEATALRRCDLDLNARTVARQRLTLRPLTCAFRLERVTGIEPALSAWESVRFGLLYGLTCGVGCP